MWAASNGHTEVALYLVEQGANKDLQNNVSIHLLRMIMMMMMMMIMMMMLMMIVYMHLSS